MMSLLINDDVVVVWYMLVMIIHEFDDVKCEILA